jgi:hypothetical protein
MTLRASDSSLGVGAVGAKRQRRAGEEAAAGLAVRPQCFYIGDDEEEGEAAPLAVLSEACERRDARREGALVAVSLGLVGVCFVLGAPDDHKMSKSGGPRAPDDHQKSMSGGPSGTQQPLDARVGGTESESELQSAVECEVASVTVAARRRGAGLEGGAPSAAVGAFAQWPQARQSPRRLALVLLVAAGWRQCFAARAQDEHVVGEAASFAARTQEEQVVGEAAFLAALESAREVAVSGGAGSAASDSSCPDEPPLVSTDSSVCSGSERSDDDDSELSRTQFLVGSVCCDQWAPDDQQMSMSGGPRAPDGHQKPTSGGPTGTQQPPDARVGGTKVRSKPSALLGWEFLFGMYVKFSAERGARTEGVAE